MVVAGWVPMTGSQLLLATPKLRLILMHFNLKLRAGCENSRMLSFSKEIRRKGRAAPLVAPVKLRTALEPEQKQIKSDPKQTSQSRGSVTDTLNTDRPIADLDADRPGLSDIAHHPAQAVLCNDLSEGLVCGIVGAWGSGKSSLVALALAELRAKEMGPIVVEFQPWLVGSKAEPLQELFGLLAEALRVRTH